MLHIKATNIILFTATVHTNIFFTFLLKINTPLTVPPPQANQVSRPPKNIKYTLDLTLLTHNTRSATKNFQKKVASCFEAKISLLTEWRTAAAAF